MGSAHTERIEALLQASHGANEPELKIALSRLSSEIKERLDTGSPNSGDFFLSALKALSRVRGPAHAELRMICLFDSVAYLFANRFDLEALEASKQLTLIADASGSKLWKRKARTLEGVAQAHLGNVAEAVLAYATALTLAQQADDIDGEVSVLVNLGNALNYGGLYREAMPCFHRAISHCQRHEAARIFEASALCNLAQSYLYLEEYQPAYDTISKSLALSSEPTSSLAQFARAIREFTFVQISLELGKLSAARSHAAVCTQFALRSGNRRSESVAAIARGLCEIHGGDVQRGLSLLEKTLASCGDEHSPQHTAALTALVRGYEHAGQPELALAHLNKLTLTLKSAREKGIFALLSVAPDSSPPVIFASEQTDLQALHLREAQLKAQVAQRDAINSRIEMLERLAVTADLREESSGEHGYRVGRIAALMGSGLSWQPHEVYSIDLAARLHDVGKVAVPDRILLSSEKLKEAERHFISAHTVIGAELLAKSNIPQLRMAEEIARHHHEWWNGEGYPSKLAGKRIPIHARIVAIADVFDALTHGRPFSPPWSMDRAIEEIRNRKGTQFDPELTDLFLELIARLRKEHVDLDEYLGRAGRNSPFLQARNKIRQLLAAERENEKMATVEGNETRH
jgi:putative two-component system response regulator